jgi:hypothetical protein
MRTTVQPGVLQRLQYVRTGTVPGAHNTVDIRVESLFLCDPTMTPTSVRHSE